MNRFLTRSRNIIPRFSNNLKIARSGLGFSSNILKSTSFNLFAKNKRFFSNRFSEDFSDSTDDAYDASEDYSDKDVYKKSEIGIGKPAPFFECPAAFNGETKTVSLDEYRGKFVVLFFYPLNFTFVCPTEILKFDEMVSKFKEINCEVLGASIDSAFSHLQWMKISRKEGGLGCNLKFPLLSDLGGTLMNDYGAANEEQTHAVRATYVIDTNGMVRHYSLNDPSVGRSVEEVLRVVKAIQFADESGEVCPVNWKPGEKTIVPDPEKKKSYFEDK